MRRYVPLMSSLVQWIVIALACLAALARPTRGEAPPTTRQAVDVVIDRLGDAQCTATVIGNLPTAAWRKNPVPADAVLRWAKLDHLWHPISGLSMQIVTPNEVRFTYTIRGLLRPTGTEWELNLQPWCPNPAIDLEDDLVLSGQVETNFGIAHRTVAFSLKDGEGKVRLPKGDKVYFTMPAPAAAIGAKPSADLQLEVTPQIMACMAKSYGYEKFPKLWLARTVLKNTGGQPMTDLRVRFRLADYTSDWSPWSRTARVYPGQTVVDAYFPVLNIDKIATLQGRRQAVLEVEYEYRLGDGKLVHDVDGRKLEILGRNERVKSNLSVEEALTLMDQYVFMPYILASFVTKDDKMIQMAAGRISGQVPGLSPASNADHAIEYVKQVHRFMLHNKIAYQTPPWNDTVQHYKYGREVLTNRAGTCVDLAIFYASVCEAVGLEPLLCTPPGHVFPMIRLPRIKEPDDAKPGTTPARNLFLLKHGSIVFEDGGQMYLAMESTFLDPKLTFEQAAQHAKKARLAMQPPLLQFDISALRRQGIYALELPEPPANAFDNIAAAPAAGGPVRPARGEQLGEPAKLIIGQWRADVIVAGQRMYILGTFKDDNTVSATIYNQQNQALNTGGGNWSFAADGTYQFRGPFEEDAKIQFLDKDTYTYTCLKSTNPLAIPGATVTNRRVK